MINAATLGTADKGPQSSGEGPGHIGIKRNYPFAMAHHPTQWELVLTGKGKGDKADEYTWLPLLKKLQWVPGVNGVRRIRKRTYTAQAETDYRNRGFTIIDKDAIIQSGPYGLDRGGYRMTYPGVGGTVYLCRWEVPKVRKNAATRLLVPGDDPECTKTYNAFRLALVEQGIIDPPDEMDLQDKIEMMSLRINRHSDKIHTPKFKQIVDRATAQVASAERATVPAHG